MRSAGAGAIGGVTVTAASGIEIALWDLTSDKEPARFTGNRAHILSLDFSPDGKMVVFRALKAGRSDLYAYHLDSRTIRNLTDDDAYDFGPSFSPDGKWIYYSSVRGTRCRCWIPSRIGVRGFLIS